MIGAIAADRTRLITGKSHHNNSEEGGVGVVIKWYYFLNTQFSSSKWSLLNFNMVKGPMWVQSFRWVCCWSNVEKIFLKEKSLLWGLSVLHWQACSFLLTSNSCLKQEFECITYNLASPTLQLGFTFFPVSWDRAANNDYFLGYVICWLWLLFSL